ncbi:MAG: hypothetical protein Q8L27_00315, partial [archaeon]|nr:hypothetical protein [archaeon]
YILTIDALVYKIKGDSLISNRFRWFVGIFVISAFFWWIFELVNIGINNWNYSGTAAIANVKNLFGFLSFATVLPALFETTELILAVHLFDKAVLKRKHKITKSFLHAMIISGMFCFFLPMYLPEFTFPLVWLSFFLILDPINYLNKQPSIIAHLKNGKLAVPLALLLSGIILGFFWEFWNYYAVIKWTYNIPFVGFLKVFEMPILGYLGYFPFAFELYAMFWFIRSLVYHKERMLD